MVATSQKNTITYFAKLKVEPDLTQSLNKGDVEGGALRLVGKGVRFNYRTMDKQFTLAGSNYPTGDSTTSGIISKNI